MEPSAVNTLGYPSRKHQYLFDKNDEEIYLGFMKKSTAFKRHIKMVLARYQRSDNICKTVNNRLSDMQDPWLSKKAEEIQSFVDE